MTSLSILDKMKNMGIIDTQTVIRLRANLSTNKLSAEIVIRLLFDSFTKIQKLENENKTILKKIKELEKQIKDQ